MKKFFIITVGVIVSLFVLGQAKDLVVKISVERGVEIVTGLRISIRSFNVGIFKSAVRIRGLKVYNPKSFKDRIMVDMPEIYVDYDLPAIIAGNMHLEELKIDLKEFIVVKNERGELNLDSLKVVKLKKGTDAGAGARNLPPIRIDDMRLKIGKAMYKNYSGGKKLSITEFNVNLDERYTDVTDPYAIVSLIVVRSLSNTSIPSAANFDMGPLTDSIQGTLSKAHTAVTRTAQQTKEALKNTTEALSSLFK